jgi:hypothetical protein
MGLFSGASAGVRLDADSTGYRREIKRAQKETKTAFGDLKKQTKGLRTAFKGIAAGLGAGMALGVGAIVREGTKKIMETERVIAQTNAVIKSTGAVAGVSAEQVRSLSNEISRKTSLDDEQIQAGQNLLLTFKGVANQAGAGNDIFTQTTHIMADMAVAMGTDTKSAALQLGKALNDPAKGMTALTRSGVSFTAQEKEKIKALVASGRTLDAQKVMVKALNEQFAGSAEALGSTMPGQIKIAKDSFADMSASLMAVFVPVIGDVITYANTLIDRLRAWGASDAGRKTMADLAVKARQVGNVIEWLGKKVVALGGFLLKHRSVVIPLTAALVGMVAAYKTFVIISTVVRLVRALTTGQLMLNVAMIANPVGLVVAALAGLVIGLVVAYKKSETFRGIVNGLWGWIKKLAVVAWDLGQKLPIVAITKAIVKSEAFRDAVKTVWSWLKKLGAVIADTVLAAIDKLKDAMEGLRKKLKPVAEFVGKIASGLGKVAGAAGGAASAIGGAFGDDWEGLGGLGLMGSSAVPPGVSASLGPFAAMARGQGLTITSGHRPGAVTADGNPSDHGTGNAIDVAGHPTAMARAARLANMLPGVKQVIYTPVGISNRGGAFMPVPPGATRQGHYDHVHIAAYQRGGRVPGGAHLIGDRVPAILEPGEFVLNRRATASMEAMLGPLEAWNGMQTGGRARRTPQPRRLTPAQIVAQQLAQAGARANVAGSPELGRQQAARQLRQAAAAAAAAQKRVDAERRVIAELERQRKTTKAGSKARADIDKKLKTHRDALAKNVTALNDARGAQANYADSVVSLRSQIESDRQAAREAAQQAEEERRRAAEEAAQAVQDQARSAAQSAFSFADAEANLAAARAEATETLEDDVAVAQRMLSLAQGRAAAIEAQLRRGDLTEETRTDLVNQLADATRAQTTLRDRVRELNDTMNPATGTGGVQIDPAQLQQLIASNDAFLAGLRDTLRNERSNITIAPTFTQPQTGVNQFLETMRYKLTQVGAGGAL